MRNRITRQHSIGEIHHYSERVRNDEKRDFSRIATKFGARESRSRGGPPPHPNPLPERARAKTYTDLPSEAWMPRPDFSRFRPGGERVAEGRVRGSRPVVFSEDSPKNTAR